MESADNVYVVWLQAHVYHLMRSDSYSRYLRSEMYKDFLNGSKKKVVSYFRSAPFVVLPKQSINKWNNFKRFKSPATVPQPIAAIPSIQPRNHFISSFPELYCDSSALILLLLFNFNQLMIIVNNWEMNCKEADFLHFVSWLWTNQSTPVSTVSTRR